MTAPAAESADAAPLDVEGPSVLETAPPSTRLRGRGLVLARSIWWVALAASLVLLAAALPLYHEQLRTLSIIPDSGVRAEIFASLNSLGLSGTFLADYSVAITLARALVYFAVALLIYRGRSDDWMALFVSFALVIFTVGRLLDRLMGPVSFAVPAAAMTGLAYASFNVQFYLFPDGRFVPRWTRWVALVWSGLAVSIALTFLVALSAGFVPQFDLIANPAPPAVLFELVGGGVIGVALTIIPLSIGVAVLRYRLWDIDLIINRTLVYVPLTAIVAGLYAASLTLSQRAFIAMTGQPSDLSLALAVLVLASTFTPIKQRLQDVVDRRFRAQAEPQASLRDLQRRVQAVAAVVDRNQLLRQLLAGSRSGRHYGEDELGLVEEVGLDVARAVELFREFPGLGA